MTGREGSGILSCREDELEVVLTDMAETFTRSETGVLDPADLLPPPESDRPECRPDYVAPTDTEEEELVEQLEPCYELSPERWNSDICPPGYAPAGGKMMIDVEADKMTVCCLKCHPECATCIGNRSRK